MRVKVQRKAEQEAHDEIQQQKEIALRPAVAADLHGGVAHPRDHAEREQQQQADDAPGCVDEVQGDVHGAQVLRLGEVFGAERVVGQISVQRSGGQLLRGVGVGGVLGERIAGAGGQAEGKQKAESNSKSKGESTQAHGLPK